jgi:hypothetical protein
VKVAKPRQDVRFDVPVVGPGRRRHARGAGGHPRRARPGTTLLPGPRPISWPSRRAESRSGDSRPRPPDGRTPRCRRSVGVVGRRRPGPAPRARLRGLRRAPGRRLRHRRPSAAGWPPPRPAPSPTSRTPAEVDAVSVAVPTADHLAWAGAPGGGQGRPPREADDARRRGGRRTSSPSPATGKPVLQIGHIERFNPAVDVLKATSSRPRSSRSTGWAPFRPAASTSTCPGPHDPRPGHRPDPDRSEASRWTRSGSRVLTQGDIANVRLRFRLRAHRRTSPPAGSPRRRSATMGVSGSSHRGTYISVAFARRGGPRSTGLADAPAGPEFQIERTAARTTKPLRRRQLGGRSSSARDHERTPSSSRRPTVSAPSDWPT